MHVIAADVLTGMDVCLSSGPAVDAIAGSTAIPGLLPPVAFDGRVLMDGGAVNNTPISHAVAFGATTVWVLPTGHACALERAPTSSLGMALHGLSLAINQRLALDLERFERQIDIRLVPPLCPMAVSPADFSHGAEIIERAREKTRDWLAKGPRSRGQADYLRQHDH